MPRFIQPILWQAPMPDCDFCKLLGYSPIKPGIYDTPTIAEGGGRWANCCHTHMLQFSPKSCQIVSKRLEPTAYHEELTKRSLQPKARRP